MNALRSLLVVSLLSLSVLTTCGGGSSKEDPVALCKQGCAKAVDLCASDLPEGVTPATYKAFCESLCTQGGSGGTDCKNSSAIISAYKGCQSKTTCAEYESCAEAIPECEAGGTGTGGASGTGTGGASGTGTGGASGTGTGGASGTGTGGASGTGTGGASGGATCADILACCNATTNPILKMACTDNYDEIKNAGDAQCALYYAQIKSTLCP